VHAFDFGGLPAAAAFADRRSKRHFKRHILLRGEFMIAKNLRCMAAMLLAGNLALATPGSLWANDKNEGKGNDNGGMTTTTPIKYLVVIFQENVSFDHYFATYPVAANPKTEIQFNAKANTPTVNGLTQGLIQNNPNGPGFSPFRLDPSQNYTCDQNHDYTNEQAAFDSGLMDQFPENTAQLCNQTTGTPPVPLYPTLEPLGTSIVMGYFDGNTVTGMWNYAQNFAMNDNSFDTNFGPSTPGAINVISGMTGNVDPATEVGIAGAVIDNVDYGDADAYYDDCASPTSHFGMKPNINNVGNIGDLLTAKGITWGWFQGGFTPSAVVGGIAQCNTQTPRLDGTLETAYSSHHNPFMYFKSTANPHHTMQASIAEIGNAGPANHEYDLSFFQQAALNGNLPAVSYLKAVRAQDGHPGNSSPLDEQDFIINTINFLESLPEWNQMAVIIAWDDSDGWYDHVIGPIVNQSNSPTVDALTQAKTCGSGVNALADIQARCGYGPRLPFLVISPFSKQNFVDHSLIDQSSVVRFIEDNWGLPRIGEGSFDVVAGSIENMFDFDAKQPAPTVFLDPLTGQVVAVGKTKK
jgi:phospholipase C